MPTIRLQAPLIRIGSQTVLHLPKSVSAQFPSRGMAMAEGTVNGVHGFIPLEPDGKGSHWIKVDASMRKAIGKGETVTLDIEPATDWPEPAVPADVKKVLAADKKAFSVWKQATPAAHWDWLRWIQGTHNADTRKKRIAVACSKLRSGMRRPCCFNRNMCTDPDVSKGGILLDMV